MRSGWRLLCWWGSDEIHISDIKDEVGGLGNCGISRSRIVPRSSHALGTALFQTSSAGEPHNGSLVSKELNCSCSAAFHKAFDAFPGSMTEDAAMQHLRRVRRRKEQASGQPKFRVVLTARDYHWWETTYELLLRPTVRESRVVTTREKKAPPPPPVKHLCMDCQEDITGLPHHQKRKRCESCQVAFIGSTSARERQDRSAEGSPVGF